MHSFALIFASVIWGTAFVAQSTGGDLLGSWTMNGMRSVIACIVLAIAVKCFDRFGLAHPPKTKEERTGLWKAGILAGLALFTASTLQQFGITLGDSAGKAGFLTANYIVLVPIFGMVIGRKCHWNVWISAAVASVGLYLLCIKGEFVFSAPDIMLLLCAIAYSVQILIIDQLGSHCDPVRMSCIQFGTVGLLSIVPMLVTETLPDPAAWLRAFADPTAMGSLLYAAVLSSGVAYTLQIVGQQGLHPAVASLLMSLESVFSVLAGWLILHEQLSAQELTGCCVIFAAILLAQLPVQNWGKKAKA